MRFDPSTHTLHAAGHAWLADPAATRIEEIRYGEHGQYLSRSRRIIVRFESGWSASIVWGDATYSSNHDTWLHPETFTEEPDLVEVGVLDHNGDLRQRTQTADGIDLEWHDVETYLTDAELVDLLHRLATLPTDFDYGVLPLTIDEVRANYEGLRTAITDAGGTPLPEWPR